MKIIAILITIGWLGAPAPEKPLEALEAACAPTVLACECKIVARSRWWCAEQIPNVSRGYVPGALDDDGQCMLPQGPTGD